MKNRILISTVLLLLGYSTYAQELVMLTKRTSAPEKELPNMAPANVTVFEYTVYSKPELPKDTDPQLIGTNFFGNEIAQKMYLLDKIYTYEAKIAPGNPATTTMTRKPVIYNSVKKLESYLKKSVKHKELSETEASEQLNQVVDTALSVFYQDTKALENQIAATDKAQDLLELYTRRVRVHYSN
ncbi:MAG TPA: hypothetical protein VHO72_15555 [Bacteroidales bacterium]|nr:hypothetical protein [Bacteroidales bacterium]